jgi:glutamyl-Q tRNA(Asp) synthetase
MIVTRFAPSPTGRLHLGHAYSAVIGHERAAAAGGKFLLRIEDLDVTRCRPEFVEAIFTDLDWLGLGWSQPLLVQSNRAEAYESALQSLRERALIYPCFCTRADIAAALSAPHGPAAAHYPGTCRRLPDDPLRRANEPHSWRLDAAQAIRVTEPPSWVEADGRRMRSEPGDFDDVVLARKDAPAAYHLACVVDDAATGVTMVVRAADLRSSTPIQRLLQSLLGLAEPTYLHHPLVTHSDGRRLAKRDLAPTLHALREQGVDGHALVSSLLAGKLPLGFAFAGA